MKKSLFLALMLALGATVSTAHAESADRNLPISINANQFDGDEVKQVATYTGNVEVHQGTLEMYGDKLELTVSPDGYRTITMFGSPSKLVRMKERRDQKTPGIEEWMHAWGVTAVYDEKADTITLIKQAKIVRSENGDAKDTSEGEKIVYDLRFARSQVQGGTIQGQRSRVSTILAPREQDNKAQPKPATPVNAEPMSTSTRLQ